MRYPNDCIFLVPHHGHTTNQQAHLVLIKAWFPCKPQRVLRAHHQVAAVVLCQGMPHAIHWWVVVPTRSSTIQIYPESKCFDEAAGKLTGYKKYSKLPREQLEDILGIYPDRVEMKWSSWYSQSERALIMCQIFSCVCCETIWGENEEERACKHAPALTNGKRVSDAGFKAFTIKGRLEYDFQSFTGFVKRIVWQLSINKLGAGIRT